MGGEIDVDGAISDDDIEEEEDGSWFLYGDV